MSDMYIDVDTAISIIVNKMPLIDSTDFTTREIAIAYNEAGMDLVWNFTTSAGVVTQTAITPTTGGVYDWVHVGDGIYKIEIPASGGGSINNDTEGYGFFSGVCTGVLPWVSPIYTFRAVGLNNLLIDDAYSATRALAGTALPNAVADGAGGLVISDAGGLDIDTKLANTNEVTAARMAALTDWINGGRLDVLLDAIPTTPMRGTNSALTALPVMPANWITASGIAAGAMNGKGNWNIGKAGYTLSQAFPANFSDLAISVTVGEVIAVNMRGTDGANTTTPDNTSIAAILADTGTTIPATIAAVDANVDSILTDTGTTLPAALSTIEGKVDTVDTVVDALTATLGVNGVGLTNLGGMSTAMKGEVLVEVVKLLTTQLAESYSAKGVAPTLAQLLLELLQDINERSVAGTVQTTKKLDGIATAKTHTIDDDTNPTAITRAT